MSSALASVINTVSMITLRYSNFVHSLLLETEVARDALYALAAADLLLQS